MFSISLPLSGLSGQRWHASWSEPALPKATFPHWQVQGTGFQKESSLCFWPSLVLPHQQWLSWTHISCSPAFLTALCKPREKLLIAPFTFVPSFLLFSPCGAQGRGDSPFLKDQEGPFGVQRSFSSSLTMVGGQRQSLKGQLTHISRPSWPLPPLCLQLWPVSHRQPAGRLGTQAPP